MDALLASTDGSVVLLAQAAAASCHLVKALTGRNADGQWSGETEFLFHTRDLTPEPKARRSQSVIYSRGLLPLCLLHQCRCVKASQLALNIRDVKSLSFTLFPCASDEKYQTFTLLCTYGPDLQYKWKSAFLTVGTR